MKVKKNKKKILFVLLLIAFIVVIFTSRSVYAEINTEYSGADSVTDENLESALDDSSLLKTIAKLIYAVGRLMEWLLGVIFKLLSGSSDFPWADKIVFNSVPLLDINFINPGRGSFVINKQIQGALQNLYSTILAIAATFFGITVMITAVKLVISTIASQKAKYKQAIIDWAVGFVLLFCIHYFISFVFYLNEQLVIVASKIVKTQLEKAGTKTAMVIGSDVNEQMINALRNRGGRSKLIKQIQEHPNVYLTWAWLPSDDDSNGAQEAFMKHEKNNKWYKFNPDFWFGVDIANADDSQLDTLSNILEWATAENISTNELFDILNNKVKIFEAENDDGTVYYNQAISWRTFKDIFYYKNKDTAKIIYKFYKDGKRIGTADNETGSKGWNPRFGNNYKPEDADEVEKEIFYSSESDFLGFLKTMYDDQNVCCYDAKQSSKDPKVVIYQHWYYEYNEKWPDNCYLISRGAKSLGYTSGHYWGNLKSGNIDRWYWYNVISDLTKLKGSSDTSSGTKVEGSGKSMRLVSDLATYFRYNSYSAKLRSRNITAVGNGKTLGLFGGNNIQIQNMIMYAILVAQSLILFISYVKRLFYVLLLAMMAPMVVVFDFFQKFGK